MKSIFLTGGKGFFGRHFTEMYQQNYSIMAPGRSELELSNANAVDHYMNQHHFDCIIHGANIGGTRKDQRLPMECLNGNLQAFMNVFKHRCKVQRFIQLGTGAEYGRPLVRPKISEEYLERNIPKDEYGFSKLVCSRMVQSMLPAKAVTLHLFGVFGVYEDYQARFISNAVVRTLLDLPIIINQDVRFDYLYVKDCARIVSEFIRKPAEYSNYNLGTGVSMKLSEIAEVVKSVLGSTNDIVIRNAELGHEYSCSNERLMSFLPGDFKFTPLFQSVAELSDWYASNMNTLNKDWILQPI